MRMRRLVLTVLLVTFVAVAGLAAWTRSRAAAADTTPATMRVTLDVDGIERAYLLDLPTATATATGPGSAVLLLLHGGGGSADSLDKQTGNLPAMAIAAGYVVARPDGVRHQWNDGRGVNADVDDVGFLATVIDDVGARVAIDRERVYAAGMSNGAFMSGRLACEPGFPVAAIAQVAGTLGVDVDRACDPDQPVSVLAILGREDPIVPYAGGPVRLPWDRSETGRGLVLGADAYVAGWRDRDGTGDEITGSSHPGGSWSAATAPDGAAVALITVEGGGHGWPGGPQYLPPALIGHVTDAFSASDAILEFLGGH